MLLPVALAVPVASGVGRIGLLDVAASFLRRHGLLGNGIVLPIALARDAGLLLLAGRVALTIVSGFAVARFARAVRLDATASAVAGLLVELGPAFTGRGADGLAGAAIVLLAAERAATRVRGGAVPLAAAVATAAALGAWAVSLGALALALALAWSVVRLLSGAARGRTAPVATRLVVGFAVGALLGSCFVVPRVAFALLTLPVSVAGSALLRALGAAPFGAWWAGTPAMPPGLFALATLLPAVALAGTAILPGGAARRGWAFRVLLAAAAVLFFVIPDATPLLRLPVALLAAIGLHDAARDHRPPLPRRAVALLVPALVVAAVGWATWPDRRAVAFLAAASVAAVVTVVIDRRPIAKALLAVVVAAAGGALAVAGA